MKATIVDLSDRLRADLHERYAGWIVHDLQVVGQGLEALVFRADTVQFGPVCIKVPWSRWISNDNDAHLDGRALLKQEAALASHLHAHGIATPRIYHLHEGKDDFDFLVSEYIEHDKSATSAYEFGCLMRAIHACPLPAFDLAMSGDHPLTSVIAERITRRLQVVEKLAQIQLSVPPMTEMQAYLERSEHDHSILHMDGRPENILSQNGHIRAIIDWSNALIGDAALELARIAEYGYLSEDFLVGYGNADCFTTLPPKVEALYRLDTAIMLGIVFLSEDPDPVKGPEQVTRIQELCASFT